MGLNPHPDKFEELLMASLSADQKDYVDSRDTAVETRVKFWVISGALAQLLAMVPIIFLLGGIYSNASASLEIIKQQQIEIAENTKWQHRRENWEMAVEMWGEERGFRPPPERRSPK